MEDEQDADETRLGAVGSPQPLSVLQEAVFSSVGRRAVALMDMLKRISYLLQVNVSDYLALVEQIQDPVQTCSIFNIRNPELHDDLLTEAERLLHNVLMALGTRIDHQRRLMTKYIGADDELMRAYEAKVRAVFVADLPSCFLRELRNFITHRMLPVAQSQQSFTKTTFEVTFVLPTAPLLEWTKWSSPVRGWLSDGGNQIRIVDAVHGYAKQTADFDTWLVGEIAAKYAKEIAELRQLEFVYERERARVFGL